MPVSTFHKDSGKWLTAFNRDSKAGDIHTISVWSKSKLHRSGFHQEVRSCEFTTYVLSAPVATDNHGYPLFDTDTCIRVCALDHDSGATVEQLAAIHAMPALSQYPARAA